MFGTETSRSASLTVCDVAEVSFEDPSSSLAEPSYSKAFTESTHQISNSNCLPYTGIHRWRLSTWCPTPPPTTPLLLFSPFCAIARIPLHPAALAFVPFGIVLVRVRVRVPCEPKGTTLRVTTMIDVDLISLRHR